mgnify:CR=1 FL=1
MGRVTGMEKATRAGNVTWMGEVLGTGSDRDSECDRDEAHVRDRECDWECTKEARDWKSDRAKEGHRPWECGWD